MWYDIPMDIATDRNHIADICRKAEVNFVAVFGSVARGAPNKKSDIDLAISFRDGVSNEKRNSITLQIYKELSDRFKRDDIEIVDVENVNSALLGAIARDGKVLYEKKSGLFLRWVSFAKRVYVDSQWLRDLAFENISKQVSVWESRK